MQAKIAETAVKSLQQVDSIEFAILFGSFAEGKENEMSDIDIGISSSKDLSLMELGLLTARLEVVFKRNVDLVILNDLYRRNPLLAYEIVSRGKVIFCRNEERLVELKTNSILSFMDTAPLRDAVNRRLKERLRSGRFGDRNYA